MWTPQVRIHSSPNDTFLFSLIYYRPQRCCEGYVFTPVCHSVHGGGLPQCMLGYHPPEQTPPQDQPPPGSRQPPGSRHPPERRPLLRTVRILLECILVEIQKDTTTKVIVTFHHCWQNGIKCSGIKLQLMRYTLQQTNLIDWNTPCWRRQDDKNANIHTLRYTKW